MKIRFHFLHFMTYILINLIHLILYPIELVTIMLIGKVSLACTNLYAQNQIDKYVGNSWKHAPACTC